MEYTNKDTKNDRWIVEHIFPHEYDKYFVEAGACNGIEASSCYVLEKHFQWTGICIEPNHNYFQKLVKNRNNSVCENSCLSNSNGTVTYLQGDYPQVHPMLGGIKSNLIRYRNDSQEIINKGKEIEIRSITLYDLLKKHNAPKVIHYLAMDIEGSELPVLEVFPFEEYQILAISIEGQQCNELLFSKGYINIENPFNTDKKYEQYFIHPSIAAQAKFIITANHYICSGQALFNQQKFSESIKAYCKAVSIDPNNVYAHGRLGASQQHNGDLAAAISSYKKAIALNPQPPAWIYINLGYTLQQQGKKEAIEAYYKAIEIASEIPFWAYENFAKALSQQERWDEAIEVCQKANKLQPDNLKIQQDLEYAKRKKQNLKK